MKKSCLFKWGLLARLSLYCPCLSLLDRGLFTGLWLVFSEALAFWIGLICCYSSGQVAAYLSVSICPSAKWCLPGPEKLRCTKHICKDWFPVYAQWVKLFRPWAGWWVILQSGSFLPLFYGKQHHLCYLPLLMEEDFWWLPCQGSGITHCYVFLYCLF